MDIISIMEQFNRTMCEWITALPNYKYHQLCLRPTAESWCLGQIYEHLIADTKYYFLQIKACQSNNENANEEKTDKAKEWFQNNSFPNIKLEGPVDNEAPPIPISKEDLLDNLNKLQSQMNKVGLEILKRPKGGKTKHPGFHYFNAAEWFQFAEMHFRHHLQQKDRMDAFLKLQSFENI